MTDSKAASSPAPAARSKLSTLIPVALCVIGVVVLSGIAVSGLPRSRSYWTDGNRIRASAADVGAGGGPRTVMWEPPRPLPGSVHANVDQYEPRLSGDGTLLVFVRGRAGGGADLMQARWTPSGWSDAAPLAEINTAEHDELGPELSFDGTALYFYSDRPGGLGGYDLWVSRANGDGTSAAAAWGAPVNLGADVNTSHNEYGPALTSDGGRAVLYFSSNRPRDGEAVNAAPSWPATVREERGRHDYDIYACRMAADGLTADGVGPVVAINTGADEGAPALSMAGDFLYFASDRGGGSGGFDLYRARRQRSGVGVSADAAVRVGEPESLGAQVNTAANELDPALGAEGFRLIFSSDRAPPAQASAAKAGNGGVVRAGTEAAAKYALWETVSREVYQERERAAPLMSGLGDLWERLWPWLLALLLLLLLLLLALWTARNVELSGRFRKLSLLAKCLLLSLLLHAIIASLMTVWRVRNEIQAFLKGSAGGTQVVLSSGSAGEIVGQVRGAFTDAPTLSMSMVDEAPALPELVLSSPSIKTIATPLAVRGVDLAAVVPDVSATTAAAVPSVVVPTPVVAETSPSADTAVALPRMQAPSTPNAEERPENTVAHATAAPMLPTSAVSSPMVNSDPTSERTPDAQLSFTPMEIGRVETETPRILGPSGSAAAVAVLTETSRVATSLPRLAAPPAAQTLAEEPTRTAAVPRSEIAAMPTPIPASTQLGQVEMARIDPKADEVAQHGLEKLVGADAEARANAAVANSAPAAAPAPMTASGGAIAPEPTSTPIAAALPRAAMNGGTAPHPRESTERPVSSGAIARGAENSAAALNDLPAPASATATNGTNGAPAHVDLPVNESANHEAAALPSAALMEERHARGGASPTAPPPFLDSTPAPPTASPNGSPGQNAAKDAAMLPPTPALSGSGSTLGPRLPSDAAPEPVETFAQRDPEVRIEMLESTGGSAETERAVALALAWFERHQEADGRWTGRRFDDGCGECSGAAEFDSDAAMTGLALQCFLGAGYTHMREGPHRETVAKALAWLTTRQRANGDLRGPDETMYSQCVATVALCEAYAMTRDPALAGAARKGIAFVLDERRPDAGTPAGTAPLGWHIMAIESARRAGLASSTASFSRASAWLDSVGERGSPGRYAHRRGEQANAAMTAEALFVRQLVAGAGASAGGVGNGETRAGSLPSASMDQSARFILGTPPVWKDGNEGGAPTYYWYYATLALFQHEGEEWRAWNEKLVPELLAHQQAAGGAAGSWSPQDRWSKMGGRLYQTAICTLSLEVYYRYRRDEAGSDR